MDTKLTLKLDKKVIEKTKAYARKQNVSLSEIVERYFRTLSEDQASVETTITPLIGELSGVVRIPDGINVKREYEDYINRKYAR